MGHLSAWAAAFLFSAGFFLAFFHFWGLYPGSRISRKFTREGAAVPSKPRPGIRSPLGGRGPFGRGGAARGRRAFYCARVGRRRAFGGRAGRGARRRLPAGRRRARPGGGAAKNGAAPARAQGGGTRGGRGRAGRAVARRRGGRGGAGAHGVKSGGPGGRGGPGAGAKSAGRAGRGGVFFGAPFFLGRRAKKPRFRLIKKRGFSPVFFVGSELIFSENLVLFIGLLFRPGGVMNMSRPEKRQKPKAAAAGGKNRRAKRKGTP